MKDSFSPQKSDFVSFCMQNYFQEFDELSSFKDLVKCEKYDALEEDVELDL